MTKCLNNSFNWPLRDDICWAPASHVLCTVISLSVQSVDACGYCLCNKEFNKVLNLYDGFVA